MSELDIRTALRCWIAEASGQPIDAITDSTALFGSGLLKSVHLLDLILLIEELSERDLDVERLGPASFKDVNTICATFFAQEAA